MTADTEFQIDTLEKPLDPDGMGVQSVVAAKGAVLKGGIVYYLKRVLSGVEPRIAKSIEHFGETERIRTTAEHVRREAGLLQTDIESLEGSISVTRAKRAFNRAIAIDRNLGWIGAYLCGTMRPRALNVRVRKTTLSFGPHFMGPMD